MEKEQESELLHKIRELNDKIEQLSRNEDDSFTKEQSTITRATAGAAQPQTSPFSLVQTEMFSLDFINSEKLEEIEAGIKETIRGVELSKAAVCKSLANIDKKKLYKQIGFDSFLQYLGAERLPLNYKTAKEYVKIGDVLLRHEEELLTVDFQEENGLKKLMYLDRALQKHNSNPKQVFKNVKECSLRDFKAYALDEKVPEPAVTEEHESLDKGQEGGHIISETISIQNDSLVQNGPEKAVLIDCSGLRENGFSSQLIKDVLKKVLQMITQGT